MEKDLKQQGKKSSNLDLGDQIKEASSTTELAVLLIFSSPKYRLILESGELADKINISKTQQSKTANLLTLALKTVQAKEKLEPKTFDGIASSLSLSAPTLVSTLKALIESILATLTQLGEREVQMVKPILESIDTIRLSIKKQELAEITSFSNAPDTVKFVSYLCRLLVAGPTKNKNDWTFLRQYFEQAIREDISKVSPKNVQILKKVMKSRPEITSESAKRCSLAASKTLKMLELIVIYSDSLQLTKQDPFSQDPTGMVLDKMAEFGFFKSKKATKSGEELDIQETLFNGKKNKGRAVPRFLIFDNTTKNTFQLPKEALTVDGLGKLKAIATGSKGEIQKDSLTVSEDTEWVVFSVE